MISKIRTTTAKHYNLNDPCCNSKVPVFTDDLERYITFHSTKADGSLYLLKRVTNILVSCNKQTRPVGGSRRKRERLAHFQCMGATVSEFSAKPCRSADYGRSIETYAHVGSRHRSRGLKNEGIAVSWSLGYFNSSFVIHIGALT